jgi:hypothetical protein
MSFIEQATLKVVDEATGPINRINAEIRKLVASTSQLKNVRIDFRVQTSQITRAISELTRLNEVAKQARAAGNFNASANVANLTAATAAATRLAAALKEAHAAAATPITIAVNTAAAEARIAALHATATRALTMPIGAAPGAAPGAGGIPPGALPPRGRGLGFLGGGVGGGGVGSFVTGAGFGFNSIVGALNAVEMAGYAAAKSMQFIGSQAMARDLTNLQSAVQASAKQVDIFEKLGGAQPPLDAKIIQFTKDERQRLWTSLLGDVQGAGETPEIREGERARAAFNVVRELETRMLPRMIAMNPEAAASEESRKKLLSDLRVNVQAMNLSTGQLTDALGNFTPEGRRTMEAIMRARAANPELPPPLIKTTLANAKSLAYSLDEDALTRLFLNAGERGVRAGNELYQASLAGTGTILNKGLNNALEKTGLLVGAQHDKKRNVIAGTGTAIFDDLRKRDPAAWWHEVLPPRILDFYQKEENRAAKADQRKPVKLTSTEDLEGLSGRDVTANELIADYVNKTFPSMRQTARQGIIDSLSGWEQSKSALEQSALAINQDVSAALAKSWVARSISLTNAIKDRAAATGQTITDFLGVSNFERDLTGAIRGRAYDEMRLTVEALKYGTLPESALPPSARGRIKAARPEDKARVIQEEKQKVLDDLTRQMEKLRADEFERMREATNTIYTSMADPGKMLTQFEETAKTVRGKGQLPKIPTRSEIKTQLDRAIQEKPEDVKAVPNWLFLPAVKAPPTAPPFPLPTKEQLDNSLAAIRRAELDRIPSPVKTTELEPQPTPSLAQTALETTGAGQRPTDLINLTSLDEASTRFQAALGGIGQTLIDGGATAGQYLTAGGEAAAAALQSQAGSIGSAIGSAAAALISSARVAVSVPTVVASRPDSGAQKVD